MDMFLAEKLYTPTLEEEDKKNLILYNNETFVIGYDEVDINGKHYYRIPRYYNPSLLKHAKNYCTLGEDIDIELRDNIKPLNEDQENAIQSIVTNNNGLVCARVGFGKTYVASDAITKIKKKTLIVVHNASDNGLMDQWINNIKKYTTCDSIGIIRADKFDVSHPICFTTVQTLCSKVKRKDTEFLSKMYEANFGITFYDECHISVGAPEFSESVKAVFSQRIYGLSATPFRSDGLSKLLEWNMGTEIYNDNILFVLPIYVALLDKPLELGNYKKYLTFGNASSLPSRYANFLSKNEEYIKYIANLVDICIDAGRNPLVLSSKIDMLYLIEEQMCNKDHVTIVHATSKNKDYTKRCVLATFGMFKMAMDVPHLDTIIFANPLTNKTGLIQAIGRVARYVKDKPNKNVLVLDICNSAYDVMLSMRQYRMYHYKFINSKAPKGIKLVNVEKVEDIAKMCKKLEY